MMDLSKFRNDFNILQKKIKGMPIIYFDNACMTLRPRQVVEAMNEYYNEYPACGERSEHALGKRVTEEIEKSRKEIAKFIGAKKDKEIIFTKNTTEGINLVANSFAFENKKTVLLSEKEHNSNLLPWLRLKKKSAVNRFNVEFVKFGDEFDIEDFSRKVKNAGLVSMVWTSNMDGTSIPVEKIIKIAHENKVPVMIDAAQATPHKAIDVRKLDADFLAFSGHKMLGPTATGVLYGKQKMLEKLESFAIGGGTVQDSTYDSMVMEEIPERFEAGLQNYAGIIGMSAATRYLSSVGMDNIEKHEKMLNEKASKAVVNAGGEILGGKDASKRSGILSFNLPNIDAHTVAIILDESRNIMVRAGRHCVHSYFNAHGIEGSVRASFYFYNTLEEVEVFSEEIKKIAEMGK